MKTAQRCIVKGCPNNMSVNVSLFRFPKEATLLRIWLKRIGRMELLKKSANYLWCNCRVCGAHFDDDSFTTYKHNRIKADAVPSLLLTPETNEDHAVTIYGEHTDEDDMDTDEDIPLSKLEIPDMDVEESIPLSRLEIPVRTDDLSTICRGCMKTSKKNLITLEDITMELFQQCTRLNASLNDGFPKAICDKCLTSCRLWSEFQAQCMHSEREFKSQYGYKDYEERIESTIGVHEAMRKMQSVKVEVEVEPRLLMESFVCNTCDETLYGDEYLSHVCGATEDRKPQKMPGNPFDLSEGISPREDSKLDVKNDAIKFKIDSSDDSNDCNGDDGKMDDSRDYDSIDDSKGKSDKSYDSEDPSSNIDSEEEEECVESGNEGNSSKDRQYKCPKCPWKFIVLKRYKTHLIFHDLVGELKCRKCDEVFVKVLELNSHCRKKHPGEKLAHYICKICQKEFFEYTALYVHSKRHTNPQDKMCTQCGEMFRTTTDLWSHIDRKHTKVGLVIEKTFKCDECHKNFVSDFQLNLHKVKVHTEKAFPCHLCTKRFKTKSQVRTHILTHLEKVFCGKCQRGFKTDATVQKHMKKCKGPTDPNKKKKVPKRTSVSCVICNEIFVNVTTLENHLKDVHRDEGVDIQQAIASIKQLKCRLCDKRFIDNKTLLVHTHASHGPKNMECKLCGKMFRNSTSLICHISSRHKDVAPATLAIMTTPTNEFQYPVL